MKKGVHATIFPFRELYQPPMWKRRFGPVGPDIRRYEMLNNIGLPGMLLIAVVVLVLFGRGKISTMMGEVGKGITAFKKGVDDGKKELEDSMADAKDVTPAEDKDKV